MRFCSFAVLFAVYKTAQNRTLKNCGFICGFKNRTKPHVKNIAVLFAVWKPHAEKFAVLNAVPITTTKQYIYGFKPYIRFEKKNRHPTLRFTV